jgi:hypothetical protein
MECRAPYAVLRDMLRYCIVINKKKVFTALFAAVTAL